MNIYLIQQEYQGYDTYDAVLVIAETEEEAINLCSDKIYHYSRTVDRIDVDDYDEATIIIQSFNAG